MLNRLQGDMNQEAGPKSLGAEDTKVTRVVGKRERKTWAFLTDSSRISVT